MIAPILVAGLSLGTFAAATAVDEYDYVIVGSGPGGGSLAANLALSNQSVFLIEAGSDNSTNLLQRLQPLGGQAAETPGHSWQYFVDHYKDAVQARRDPNYTYRQTNGSYYIGSNPPEDAVPLGIYYPRGATLGGSSQVNAMNFAWAPDSEWDHIAELTGDESWNHREMRRHLLAVENCTYVPEGTPGHGFDGYIETSLGDSTGLIAAENVALVISEWIRQAEGIDIGDVEEIAEFLRRDFNRIDPDRYESALTFLTPAALSPTTASRSSIATYINRVVEAGYPLTLSLESLATKILLEQPEDCHSSNTTKPKAYGVEYMVGEGLYSADGRYDPSQTGEIRTVRARKEVIVAGGTFNTPQILKLSGIGPRKELEDNGIPVIVELPAVGKYMHENYEVSIVFRSESNFTSPDFPCTLTFDEADPCFLQWRDTQSGPYAGRLGAVSALWRSSQSWNDETDLMFLNGFGYENRGGFYPGYSHVTSNPAYYGSQVVKMQSGNAAGTVELASADPRQAPKINFNYFAEDSEREIAAISDALNLAIDIIDGTGLSYTIVRPDLSNGMEQAIKDTAFGHHATSSCRIGRKGDRKGSCVDSKFRVHGVEGLRIVDASVLPRSPGGMPNAPTFTISRKAYEEIMKDA